MASQSCAEVVAEPARQLPVPSSAYNQPPSMERVGIDEEVKSKIGIKVTELTENISELKGHIQKVHLTTQHIETHTAGGMCSVCEVFTFKQYSLIKYPDLERQGDGVQYMMNDCLKFRIHITVV